MALHLKLKPEILTLTHVRPFSSSTRPFPLPPDDSNGGGQPTSSSPPSFEGFCRRVAVVGEKFLNANSNPTPSLHELFKNSVSANKRGPDPSEKPDGGGGASFDSIRESLHQLRSSPRENTRTRSFPNNFNLKSFQESLRSPSISSADRLPESIFGRELREKNKGDEPRAAGVDGETTGALSTEFVKMYSCEELGEKLPRLGPVAAGNEGEDRYSLKERNRGLAKLREMPLLSMKEARASKKVDSRLEEKETKDRMGRDSVLQLEGELAQAQGEACASKKVDSRLEEKETQNRMSRDSVLQLEGELAQAQGEACASKKMACSRHHWTTIEDAKLVECLIDLASDEKWKTGNGTFRAGYAKQLQVWLHEKLPGCSLQASPHINSRVRHMKRQYCAIAEMLGASGFGWNDELKCVVCDKDVFQDWVKSHPTAKGLRNNSFPYYDDLGAIFGKDRARGEEAAAPADVVEAMEEEATNEVQVHGLDDIQENADVDENVSHSYAPIGDASSNGMRARKRTTGDSTLESLVGVMKNMGKLYEETYANVTKIVKYFEIEAEWGSRRVNVFEEISKVEGFSDGEMLRAGEILSRDAARANYFITLPKRLRKLYLQGLLISNN